MIGTMAVDTSDLVKPTVPHLLLRHNERYCDDTFSRVPGYHHVKPHIQTIPKMWNLLDLGVFERKLLLLKVGRL